MTKVKSSTIKRSTWESSKKYIATLALIRAVNTPSANASRDNHDVFMFFIAFIAKNGRPKWSAESGRPRAAGSITKRAIIQFVDAKPNKLIRSPKKSAKKPPKEI